MHLKLVLVPGWVEKALSSVNEPLTSLLDLDRLSSILSKEDVTFYVYLNESLFKKIHPFVHETFPLLYLTDKVMSGVTTNFTSDEFMNLYERVEAENQDPELELLTDSLLTGETEDQNKEWEKYLYEIFPIQDNVMGYRLKEIPSLKEKEASQIEIVQAHFRAIDETIKRMLTYLSFEDVARTKIFSQFIRISRHAVSV